MRRTFLLKSLLLLCALVAGMSSVWADDITYTFTSASWEATVGGSAANWTSGKDGGGFNNNGIQVTNNANYTGANGTSPISFNNISEVVLTYNTNKSAGEGTAEVKIGDNDATSKNWAYSGSADGRTANFKLTYSYETPQTGSVKITLNTTTNSIYLVSCKITYNTAPEGTTAAPTISGDTPFLNNTTITINNATSAESADIYYTLNGDNPTTTTSATCFAYSAPFTIDATTTVKAIAKKSTDNNASSVVSKTFTKANLMTVAQARAAIDNSSTNDVDFVRGIIAKVGTLNNNGQLIYWISDDGSMNSGNIQCYNGKNVGGAAFEAITDLEIGDIITVKGELEKFNNSTYQFKANNEVVSITPRTKVNIATFTATTTTLVLGSTTTTNTTVTNNQSGWTPIGYSYESDDTDVATIDDNGVITAVAKGTANITVTPVVSATDPTYKVGESKSLEIIVKNPSYTATFSVNGTTTEESVEEGEAITFPTPASIGGKPFVGWVTTPIEGTTNTAPASLVKSATMGNANVTYYAVFASGTETEGWKKLAASEVSEAGTYALLTTDGHAFNGSISSGHGQVTTNAFEFVNDVATSAPDGTCEITLTVSGSGFTMYNATNKYLYATAASSGKLAWHNSESSYWSYASSNWKYNSNSAYLRSYSNSSIRTYGQNNGDVLVFAQKTTIASYSDYCTTVISDPSDPEVSGTTVTLTTTANMDGWRSFYDATKDYEVDANTTIYVAAVSETAGSVTLNPVAATAIPHGEAVILKTTDAGHSMTLTETTGAETLGANVLTVTDGTNDADGYRLGYKNGIGVAFFKYTATAPSAGIVYIAKANVNTGATAPEFLTIGGETTGIKSLTPVLSEGEGAVYDLQGRKVAQPTKGLYIVNGRKVVVK